MKLCECGCGQPAPIASKTSKRFGWVSGKPMRYIRGHATKGKPVSEATRQKLRISMTGREHWWGAKISAAMIGEKGPNWHGGKIYREGRCLIYVGKENSMADTYGYVYEHRLIISEKLGRKLEHEEKVHHLDCDPTNNKVENLVIVTNSQHSKIHNLIRKGTDPLEVWREICG